MTDAVAVTSAERVKVVPFALAQMSEDFFLASQMHHAKTPTFNYFLYCASIELGLKSVVLHKDNSSAMKKLLKKEISHDLNEIYKEFQKHFPHQNLLNEIDQEVLEKINPFYSRKGMEYFTGSTIVAAMKGYSPFPELSMLENVALKINTFIKEKNYFM